MRLKPMEDRVLLKRIDADVVTKGGIIIPDTAKEKPVRGEVVAVGPGKRDKGGELMPMTLKPGDTVLYGKYAGSDIKIDDQEYLIVREEDILGIIED